jgi:hypothetical protein
MSKKLRQMTQDRQFKNANFVHNLYPRPLGGLAASQLPMRPVNFVSSP